MSCEWPNALRLCCRRVACCARRRAQDLEAWLRQAGSGALRCAVAGDAARARTLRTTHDTRLAHISEFIAAVYEQ
eukprot:6196789-Pleurochrysis_carterae.AAC.1